MSDLKNTSGFKHNARLNKRIIYHGSCLCFVDGQTSRLVIDYFTKDGRYSERRNTNLSVDLSTRFDYQTGSPLEQVNVAVRLLRQAQEHDFQEAVAKAAEYLSAEEIKSFTPVLNEESFKVLRAAIRLRKFGADREKVVTLCQSPDRAILFNLSWLTEHYGHNHPSYRIQAIADKARSPKYLADCFPEVQKWNGLFVDMVISLRVFAALLAEFPAPRIPGLTTRLVA